MISPAQKAFAFFAIGLATFLIVLDYSIANVSIPYIAGDLAISTDQGTYVITSFAVGNAIGLLMTGWLTKRIGKIKLMTMSLGLFTLFSFTCGLSFTLELLVLNRFIQGFVSGPLVPLSQSLVISLGTSETRARDLSIWSTIVVTAPVAGPLLGGYISYWYNWSWIFFINIPVGLFCMAVIWLLLRSQESPIEKAPGDIWGIILLVIGVTCLQIWLDKGQDWDWLNSNLIRMLMIGSAVAFIYLFLHEKWKNHPLIELELFKIPLFTISIIAIMVSYAVYFGTVVLVPLWLQEFMGYDAITAGIAVCPLGIAPILFSLVAPILIRKFGNVRVLVLGMIFFMGASFYTAYFTTAVDLFHIGFSRFLFGFGFVFYMTPLLGMAVEKISMEKLPSATGIFHFFRSMVGAVGTSVFTTLWERRTIFHHERVGGSLTKFNPVTPQDKSLQSLQELNNSLDQQAALLSINDAFFLMGWLYVGLIVMLIGYYFYSLRHSEPSQPVHNILSVE